MRRLPFARELLVVGVAVLLPAASAAARSRDRAHAPAPTASIEFRASFDRETYGRADPLQVTFHLKNTGTQPVWVNTRFYLAAETAAPESRDVFLKVTAPSGAEVPCTFSHRTGLPKSEYFQLLAPGQDASSEHPRDLRAFFDLKETGTYRVVATYANAFGAELGLETVKGPSTSAPVTFTVTQ